MNCSAFFRISKIFQVFPIPCFGGSEVLAPKGRPPRAGLGRSRGRLREAAEESKPVMERSRRTPPSKRPNEQPTERATGANPEPGTASASPCPQSRVCAVRLLQLLPTLPFHCFPFYFPSPFPSSPPKNGNFLKNEKSEKLQKLEKWKIEKVKKQF